METLLLDAGKVQMETLPVCKCGSAFACCDSPCCDPHARDPPSEVDCRQWYFEYAGVPGINDDQDKLADLRVRDHDDLKSRANAI
tara:strand:- start:11774 stop:12028 length:255 start_codon:yes stop_codon:yes gene_type:complete